MTNLDRAFKKLTKLKDNLQDLTEEEAYLLFKDVLKGNISPVRTSAFLTAMRIKGESPEELLGVIRAMKEDLIHHHSREDMLDLALNYDGKTRTPYILPSAVWIAYNYGLGFTNHFALKTPVKEGTTLYEVVRALNINLGIEFADQKDFAPHLYRLMGIRRELGFRTFINTAEKLLNPFNTRKVIVSVFHKPFVDKVGALLELLGFDDYLIIKGLEGGIEPLPDRPTLLKKKGREPEVIDPASLDLKLPDLRKTEDVLEISVRINREIIEGSKRDEFFNWALYTASILLYAWGKCSSVRECLELLRSTNL